MKKSRMIAAAAASAAAAAVLAVSAGAYTGYLGFQNTVYSFRNAWNDGTYGLNAGNDAFKNVVVWGGNDPETFPDYEDYFDYDVTGYLLPVQWTDADITEDGTYTVALDGFDWTLDGAASFNLLFVNTDIPIDSGAVIKNCKVLVDGAEAQTIAEPWVNPDEKEYVSVLLENIWNSDIVDRYSGAYPTASLAIQFDVEGLSSGAVDAAPAEEAVTVSAPAESGDTTAAVTSVKDSPDTGVEDVAVIAGLAIAAGAGIVLARKRK